MRLIWPLATAALVLAGCSPPEATPREATPPEAYARLQDRLIVRLGLDSDLPPCTRVAMFNGRAVTDGPPGHQRRLREWMGDETCYRLGQPERLHGVWRWGFEQSSFQENAVSYDPSLSVRRHNAWLVMRRPPDGPSLFDKTVVLDFIGRRSLYPGHYGHMGGSRTLVVVDKVISYRDITPPKDDGAKTVGTGAPFIAARSG